MACLKRFRIGATRCQILLCGDDERCRRARGTPLAFSPQQHGWFETKEWKNSPGKSAIRHEVRGC